MGLFNFKEDKESKELKEKIKKIETKELREDIKSKKEYLSYAKEIYDKRKDRDIKDKISENIYDLIEGGLIIFVFAIFYFGALPNFFGVNNEFINPINNPQVVFNESINISGINNTFYFLGYEGTKVTNQLMEIGAEHPTFWFWFFWIGVLYFLVIPMIKLMINIIKLMGVYKMNKEGKDAIQG